MTDSEGNIVHPAAMNYAQYARALQDSIDYNLQEEYPDAIVADTTYDDNASRFRQNLKTSPSFRQEKVGGETMQEHHDFARDRAKRDTSMYMREGEGNNAFGPDVNIQRTPRPEAKRTPQEDEMHNLSQEIGQLAQTREEEHGFKLPPYPEEM